MGYPTGVFAPALKSSGQTVQASHVNDLDTEVVAIESQLLTGSTFSATLGGSGGQSGQSATGAGFYTIVGKRVNFEIRMSVTTVGTITGNVLIGNLPYVANSSGSYLAPVTCGYWEGLGAAFVNITGYIPAGQNYIVLIGVKTAVATSLAMAQADLADGCTLVVSGSFEAIV